MSARKDEAARKVNDARELWYPKVKTDEAKEVWKQALLAQKVADDDYWAVTGEYIEVLWPA